MREGKACVRPQLKELMVRLLGRFGRRRARSSSEPRNAGQTEPIDEAKRNVRLGKEAIERREFPAALELFQRVIDSGLEDSEALYGWGLAALQFGRTGEASEAFHRALNAKWPHPEAALKLAELALIDHDDTGARELYGRALKIAPNYAEAHLGRAKVEARLGLEVEALESFRRAFEINPHFPEAGLRLAEWTLAKGDAAEALAIYRRVLEVAPSLAEAAYGAGVAALELARIEEAQEFFRHALNHQPDYAAAITASAFLSIFPGGRDPKPAKSRRPLICVPVLPYLRGWLGGQIYLLNFARTMATLPKSERPRLVIVVVDDWQKEPGLRELLMALSRCDAVIGVIDQAGQLSFQVSLLDRYLGTNQKDQGGKRKLLAKIDWTFPVLYPSWGVATVPRPIFWIPDFQHRFWPNYFKAEELVGRDRDITALAKRNVSVVFSSHDAESHFDRFYPAQHCRSHVWHFRTAPDPEPRIGDPGAYAALGLPRRFYYTPNQFWPHKNHVTLFRGLRRLLDDGHDVTFVCTGSDLGSKPDSYQRSLLSLIEELDLGQNLRLLGILPRTLQLELFRRACAIIQPSLFEGWSTVIEDARSFGRTLIVSDIPLHREQADGNAIFFSAQDHIALAAAVSEADSQLAPGPDIEREKASREAVEQNLADSARAFLDILGVEERSS